jgi:hypothetical protein
VHIFESDRAYLVRLDAGEEVVATLARFVAEAALPAAAISGIGVVKDAVLGYFDQHRREYLRRTVYGEMELLSFTGNASWVDDAPLIHAHVTLGGPDFATCGGHLFAAEIGVTGEFFVAPLSARITRALDERTGLKLLEG